MKNIYYLLLLCTIFSGLSCKKDFFKLEFPPQPLIRSMTSLNQAVGGVYYAMMANDGALSTFDHLAVYAAAAGDESVFISTAGNISSVRELFDRNNTNDNEQLTNAFIPAYDAIRHASLWLSNIDRGDYNALDGQDQLPALKGELYFLRAYQYWVLVKMFHPPYQKGGDNTFKGVPLVTTGIPQGLSDALSAPAGTTEEVYTLIKKT